jgi:hypothetical protein
MTFTATWIMALIWLAAVVAVVFWRGWFARMPGCEERPYIHYYGVHQSNLCIAWCVTRQRVDIIVPFTLNSWHGGGCGYWTWMLKQMYQYGYYPLAVAVVLGTAEPDSAGQARHVR